MTAPPIDPLERDDELFRVTNLRAIHYTFLGNLFRMCGLALPSGRTPPACRQASNSLRRAGTTIAAVDRAEHGGRASR